MEKQRIIDAHAHLGDIFMDMRNVIFKKGLRVPNIPDAFKDREDRGFTGPFLRDETEEAVRELIDISLEKSHVNTLENYQATIEENGVDYVCTLPILPSVSFEDLKVVESIDKRFLACTCIDFNLGMDAGTKLLEDSNNGAYMLKLHPVMNNVACTDPLVYEAVSAWEQTGKPVAVHCGTNQYYYTEVNDELTTREFGEPHYVVELAKNFPGVNIVAAHGGGMRAGNLQWLGEQAKDLPNLYTDTTFRAASDIKIAIELFGKDRVMFGTDYPFGSYGAQIEQVMIATEGDQEVRDAVFWQNIMRLLNVELY